jgi:AcrR family transcriptional regulator
LGRREGAVLQTRQAILAAARDLLTSPDSSRLSAGAVARLAGVSRVTVYNQFGSMAGLLREVAEGVRIQVSSRPLETADGDVELRGRIADSCSMWAADPGLFRGLPTHVTIEIESPADDRGLAERLAASGRLRPGCSLKEAEDVIGAITSFQVFDRLYRDGRRSQGAVVEILMRLAGSILVSA